MTAVRLSDGVILWSKTTNLGPQIELPPSVSVGSTGTLYIQTNVCVRALNASTGAILASWPTSAGFGTVAIRVQPGQPDLLYFSIDALKVVKCVNADTRATVCFRPHLMQRSSVLLVRCVHARSLEVKALVV